MYAIRSYYAICAWRSIGQVSGAAALPVAIVMHSTAAANPCRYVIVLSCLPVTSLRTRTSRLADDEVGLKHCVKRGRLVRLPGVV